MFAGGSGQLSATVTITRRGVPCQQRRDRQCDVGSAFSYQITATNSPRPTRHGSRRHRLSVNTTTRHQRTPSPSADTSQLTPPRSGTSALLTSPSRHPPAGSAPVITSPPAAAPPSSDLLLPIVATNSPTTYAATALAAPALAQHHHRVITAPHRRGFAQLATPPPPTRAAPRPLTSPYGHPVAGAAPSSRPARRERHPRDNVLLNHGCHELADEFSARRISTASPFARRSSAHAERRGTYNISRARTLRHHSKTLVLTVTAPEQWRGGGAVVAAIPPSQTIVFAPGDARWWIPHHAEARRPTPACDRFSLSRNAHSRLLTPTTPGHRGGPVNGTVNGCPLGRPVIRPHRQTITFARPSRLTLTSPSPERDHQRGNLPIVSRS